MGINAGGGRKFKFLVPCKGYLLKIGRSILIISVNLATTKLTRDFSGIWIMEPHPKHLCIFINKELSRMCWTMLKFNWTANPIFVLDGKIYTLKQPSPSINPTSQLRSIFFVNSTLGLSTGWILGKFFANSPDIPLLSEARNSTIFFLNHLVLYVGFE